MRSLRIGKKKDLPIIYRSPRMNLLLLAPYNSGKRRLKAGDFFPAGFCDTGILTGQPLQFRALYLEMVCTKPLPVVCFTSESLLILCPIGHTSCRFPHYHKSWILICDRNGITKFLLGDQI